VGKEMGGKAKTIVPLIALAAVGIATGGFGLAAGGAAAAGAGAGAGAVGATTALPAAALVGGAAQGAGAVTAATTAATAATTAGSALTAGSLVGGAAQGAGLAAGYAIPAVGPGAVSAGLTAGTAAQTGFFASLSTLDKIGLGFKGLSAAGSGATALSTSNAQKAAIAAQENENKLITSEDKLSLANQSLENTKRLRGVLAAQQVQAASQGVAASAQLADAAFADAQSGDDILGSRQAVLDGRASVASDAFSARSRLAGRRGAGQAVGSLLDFSSATARTVRGRR
tara:strand:+ start:1787 stop:2641 length:855 start_codon:yes stop_codon:yes gene_type:complete